MKTRQLHTVELAVCQLFRGPGRLISLQNARLAVVNRSDKLIAGIPEDCFPKTCNFRGLMMLRLAKILTPMCVVFVAIAASYADKDSKEQQVAAKDCKQCDTACSECQQCPVAKAMEALPSLVYRIGDETTTSPVQAGRIATKLKRKVEFVVADKVFKNEPEAFAAMVDMTEKFVGDFAKPRKCDESGNTIVAGKSVCCEVAAGQVAAVVKKAMDDVKVTYLVGNESVCCPDEAKALAEKSGEKVVQLVAGQKCSGCSTTTRLNLAHAKYKAAIEALLAADKKNTESSDSSTPANGTENKVTAVSAS